MKREQVLKGIQDLLTYLGEDVKREGLLDTPERYLKSWEKYWGVGYNTDPKQHIKLFNTLDVERDMVIIKDIPLYSHCEHHIAPIVGKVSIGYLSSGKVLGLSKFSRIVDSFARKLQIQERLTNEIVDFLYEELSPIGIGVIIEAEHLCMSSRGIQIQNSKTTTSSLRGTFKKDLNMKTEFLNLVGNH